MKKLFTTILIAITAIPGLAQGIADYYQLPVERATQTRSTMQRTLARYGSAYVRERWYIAAEGFARTDKNQLNGNFNGLIDTETTTRLGWGMSLGWVSRERWAVEAGYARSPIHSTLSVQNGYTPFIFRSANDKNGFVLRGKYKLPLGPRSMSRSGLWLGAGLWLVPNSGRTFEPINLRGYDYRGGYRPSGYDRVDTLRITSNTRISPYLSGLAEASAEYVIQLGGRTELGLFARKNWGLGNSMMTDLTYRINGGAPQQASLRGSGNGWSFGISMRFNYALRHDLRRMPNVYELRGNNKTSSSRLKDNY